MPRCFPILPAMISAYSAALHTVDSCPLLCELKLLPWIPYHTLPCQHSCAGGPNLLFIFRLPFGCLLQSRFLQRPVSPFKLTLSLFYTKISSVPCMELAVRLLTLLQASYSCQISVVQSLYANHIDRICQHLKSKSSVFLPLNFFWFCMLIFILAFPSCNIKAIF